VRWITQIDLKIIGENLKFGHEHTPERYAACAAPGAKRP
jgi:hypothetical protein